MLKILVPTDYSPEAKNACLYAYEFAKYTNSEIVLYHAMPLPIPVTDIPFENYYLDEEEEINLLISSYKQLIKAHHANPEDVAVSAKVSTHNQINVGIDTAFRANDCDLIIMGTHGASGFREFFLGSNTARLIAHSNLPIITIPKDYRFEPIYHIIYASDLVSLEEELDVIEPFAKVFHAVLEIFYFDYAGPESEKLMLEAEKFIRHHTYKNITLNVKKGNLQYSISENLKRHINPTNTQMLILYKAKHGWLDNLLLGSNSQKMVLDPPIPVLVMPKNDESED